MAKVIRTILVVGVGLAALGSTAAAKDSCPPWVTRSDCYTQPAQPTLHAPKLDLKLGPTLKFPKHKLNLGQPTIACPQGSTAVRDRYGNTRCASIEATPAR